MVHGVTFILGLSIVPKNKIIIYFTIVKNFIEIIHLLVYYKLKKYPY